MIILSGCSIFGGAVALKSGGGAANAPPDWLDHPGEGQTYMLGELAVGDPGDLIMALLANDHDHPDSDLAGPGGIMFSLVGGSLPAGIELAPDGTFTGTAEAATPETDPELDPTAPPNFRVRATDRDGAWSERYFYVIVVE